MDPRAAADAFDTLGVEARFDLDDKALEARVRELSRALHPDRYVDAPPAERRMALGRAIDVNAAFRALRDPVLRAEALLRRAGVEVNERTEPPASPALLMQAMEAREELADAAQARSIEKVAAIAARAKARKAAVSADLASGFAAAGADVGELTALLPKLGELRYVRRLLDEVGAIEERLSP
ncbi:MAG TPA: Fe-S protein assembly co-chaperone HscB [Byssovorax sp.]|jgi:molecular chaperone HscB